MTAAQIWGSASAQHIAQADRSFTGAGLKHKPEDPIEKAMEESRLSGMPGTDSVKTLMPGDIHYAHRSKGAAPGYWSTPEDLKAPTAENPDGQDPVQKLALGWFQNDNDTRQTQHSEQHVLQQMLPQKVKASVVAPQTHTKTAEHLAGGGAQMQHPAPYTRTAANLTRPGESPGVFDGGLDDVQANDPEHYDLITNSYQHMGMHAQFGYSASSPEWQPDPSYAHKYAALMDRRKAAARPL